MKDRKCKCGHLESEHKLEIKAFYYERTRCSKCDCKHWIPERVGGEKRMTMMELVYDGVVHYRRPKGHPDIIEWIGTCKRNPHYTIRKMKVLGANKDEKT